MLQILKDMHLFVTEETTWCGLRDAHRGALMSILESDSVKLFNFLFLMLRLDR
jgi:hypothetical protein